ncbi:isopenicillin N synthase family dioxygenase [Streptomyces sp. NPDC101150]|uniref:isopenicillin N synthase family dioxygenase n=1 Tax=Streptomyces sp. NPDC101150 TaxID=3366114 RepID=UPI00381F4A54
MTPVAELDMSHPAFVDQLRDAAHAVGICYLTGHGLAPSLPDDVLALSRAFFALPDADRQAVDKIHSPRFRGYTPVGRELTGGRTDWREVFDIARERPCERVTAGDPPWRRLYGPNQWPDALPQLRPTLLRWHSEIDRIGRTVLAALAQGLGVGAEALDGWFGEDAHVRVKLIHYPPRPSDGHEQGAGAHKDRGFMTFILQDGVGGLQIQHADGTWSDVPVRNGTLVLNFGEMGEVAGGGFITATPHRVIAPTAGRDRYSVIGFYNPHLDAHLTPLPLPPGLAARARGVSDDPANPYLTPFGRNELKGWLRGHPHIAAVHFPEELARYQDTVRPAHLGEAQDGAGQ